MRKKPELSVVVPVFNEQERVESGLKKILGYLNKQKFSWELIIVDDGSIDSTSDLTRRMLQNTSNAKLLLGQHLGKGGAIKKGVLSSNGKWVLFLDIDLATPMEELNKFMQYRTKHDVIIGSRKMKGARVMVHQPKFREFGGKVFTALTNALVTKGISDITCGFKMFESDLAKRLFKKSRLTDWSFDAEILYLAQRQGKHVKELPVSWRDDPDTKVSLIKDTLASLLGLAKIRIYDLAGKYD